MLYINKGNGRIALQSVIDGRYTTVNGFGGLAEVRFEKEEQGKALQFQWQNMLRGDIMLMSLTTNKHLLADPHAKSLASADAVGAWPDRKGGACFVWKLAAE